MDLPVIIVVNYNGLGKWANTESPARLFIWMKQRPAIDRQRNRLKGALTPSRLGATDPSNSDNGDVCVRVCVRACVRAWCVCNIR